MLNKRNNKISSILMVCEKMKMLYFQHESASRGFYNCVVLNRTKTFSEKDGIIVEFYNCVVLNRTKTNH